MSRRSVAILIALCFALASFASAQSPDNPTVAVLRFGGSHNFSVTESMLLNVLEANDFISADERSSMQARDDLAGENLNIVWSEAGWDLATANLMVETALDAGADVIVALTTPVAQAVINATLDMDDPPAVLFASVYHPYEAGIAQSTCVKPAHVTGSQILPRYDDLLLLLSIQAPETKTIGTVFNSSETSGAIGAEAITEAGESEDLAARAREISGEVGASEIAEMGEDQGLTVLQTAVTSLSELPAAIEGLVSRGMEALLLPIDSVTAQGLHNIAHLSYEYQFPIFYASVGSVFDGATFGVGFYSHYQQGVNLGRMLTAYLNGEMDPATTAISVLSGSTLGVNLDAAASQGVEVVEHLRTHADVLIQGGDHTLSAAAAAGLVAPSVEQLREAGGDDAAFIESLQCTDEMIAEQQAALDAAGE